MISALGNYLYHLSFVFASISALILNVVNMINSFGHDYALNGYHSDKSDDQGSNQCGTIGSTCYTFPCKKVASTFSYCSEYEDDFMIIFYPVWISLLFFLLCARVQGLMGYDINDLRYFIAREKVKDRKMHRVAVILLVIMTAAQIVVNMALLFRFDPLAYGSVIIATLSFGFNNALILSSLLNSKYSKYKSFSMRNDFKEPIPISLDHFPRYKRISIYMLNYPDVMEVLGCNELNEEYLKEFGSVTKILSALRFIKAQATFSRDSEASQKRHTSVDNPISSNSSVSSDL